MANRQWFFVHNPNDRIFLAEDPPAGATETAVKAAESSAEGGKAKEGETTLDATTRGFVHQVVKSAIRDATTQTSEQIGSLRSLIEGMGKPKTPTAGGETSAAEGQEEGTTTAAGNEGGENKKHETDVSVRLARLEAALTKSNARAEQLTQDLGKERESADLEKRNGQILAIAAKAGARDPSEVLLLTQGSLVKDEKDGWLYGVESKEFGGKEFLSAAEYIPRFLSEKSHLKKTAVRQGSGAGGGVDNFTGGEDSSEMVDGRVVNEESLADSVWFNKNRAAIHKVLESRMKRFRQHTPSMAGNR